MNEALVTLVALKQTKYVAKKLRHVHILHCAGKLDKVPDVKLYH